VHSVSSPAIDTVIESCGSQAGPTRPVVSASRSLNFLRDDVYDAEAGGWWTRGDSSGWAADIFSISWVTYGSL